MRPFLAALLALPLALCGCVRSPATAAPAALAEGPGRTRPNIVVFLVDDMGPMDTSVPFLAGADGRPAPQPLNRWYRTPSMERLAAQGMRFSQFYAHSVCSPSRAALMTGQNAARHHTTNWINPYADNRDPHGPPEWNWKGLDQRSITLPRLLAAEGYRTIHVGKGHFGPAGSEGADPRNLGFEVAIAGAAIGHPGSYGGDYGKSDPKGGKQAVPGLEAYHGSGTHLTDALTLEANKAVDQALAEHKPFFLHLAHYAAHSPFEADPRFIGRYQGKPKEACAFATLIEGMDKSLGDLLDHLQKLGVADNTLVFFLGDNGSDAPLGDPLGHTSSAPLRGKKGSCYEGGVRVPFIAAWAKPDPRAPAQRDWPVAAGALNSRDIGAVTDLLPTILAVTGTPAPAYHPLDGASLQNLLAGKPDPGRGDAFLTHFPHAHRSDYFTTLRVGDWKLIHRYFDAPADELYDLRADPYENTDLAAREPAKLAEIRAEMARRLAEQNAQFPVDDGGREVKVPR